MNCNFDKELSKNPGSSNNLVKIKDYEHPNMSTNKLLSKNTQEKLNKIRDTNLKLSGSPYYTILSDAYNLDSIRQHRK